MGRSMEDRISEYVDSERMRQRLKVGDQISCLIHGNYGLYRTQVSLRKKLGSSCSCPSDYYPCKHVDALLETYRINPRSFHDFDIATSKKLVKMDRSELLQLVRQMVIASPTSLSALGVQGFESEEENEDYDSR
jgi:hypothetical protein